MILWIGFTILLAIALAFLAIPLLRRMKLSRERHNAQIFATGQLTELERQLENGNLAEKEYEDAKSEVERRLLKNHERDAKEQHVVGRRAGVIGAAIVSGWVAVGSVMIYDVVGNPALTTLRKSVPIAASLVARQQPAQNTGTLAGAGTVAGVDEMIANLSDRLEANPDDAEGWRMLGWSYFQTDNFLASVTAYEKSIELDDSEPVIFSVLGEAIVRSEGGSVTDRALGVFHRALALDPDDPRARFFQGMALEQRGNPQGALTLWTDILGRAPADADWAPGLQDRVNELAASLGQERPNPILNDLPQSSETAAPGPTVADVSAAQDMSAQDRQDMILGMVDRLAGRLEENPDDTEGWIRLMRSYLVLNDPSAAQSSLEKARLALAKNADAFATIAQAASQMGLK